MSLIKIANALGDVQDITGEECMTVGASIFVPRHISEEERSEIEEEVGPQRIKEDDLHEESTRVDL